MNTGMCDFGTLIYFHIDSYWFLKNGALDGAQWSTDNITISPDTSRKKVMDMKTINLDYVLKRLVVLFSERSKMIIDNLAVF